LRLALLGGVSLISWGIVVVRAPEALAQQNITASTGSTVFSNGSGIFVNPDVDLTGAPGISNNSITGTIYSQGTIESNTYGVVNSSIVGTLTNAGGGTIFGHSDGVYNTAGSIGTLSNNGLISSAVGRGVQNQGGTIGLITNSGTITGSSGIAAQTGIGTIINEDGGHISSAGPDYGVYVNAHVDLLDNESGGTISSFSGSGVAVQSHGISTLTNSGVITGNLGIDNLGGTIGTLENTGHITGTVYGVNNDDHIGTLTNSGEIEGTIAVYNSGHIGTLDNTGYGIIGGGTIAIENTGTIGHLSNATSAAITAMHTAIYNYGGHIGTLTNSGFINAEYGIGQYTGTIGTLVNTGGVVGSDFGIYNEYAKIGTLSNSGSIIGVGDNGIRNLAYIGTLANLAGGTISGYETGVSTEGTIVDFTNGGLIESMGVGEGVYNNGTIADLTNETGGTISGYDVGIYNDDYGYVTITALTNETGGTISGYSYGIQNYGTITGLTNSGLIESSSENTGYTGTIDGIYNEGAIGTLTNLAGGTIAGGSAGVFNYGEITTLTNSGMIESTGGGEDDYGDGTLTGIYNDGTIGGLANQAGGTIYGYETGIYNGDDGTITALTNQAGGVITGSLVGVYNYGGITDLTNSGLIGTVSSQVGIANGGIIGTLTNEAGGVITGSIVGVDNDGLITNLTNSGLIASTSDEFEYDFAPDGILNTGTIGALTNQAGGTISGDLAGLDNFDFGTISEVSNAGTISGGEFGVFNFGEAYPEEETSVEAVGPTILAYQAAIDSLNNSNVITGGSAGIFNAGYIGTLINSGAITGGYDGIYNGLYEYYDYVNAARAQSIFTTTAGYGTGYIASLTNTGIISGGTAGIYNEGTIGAISNSGVISGSIYGIYNGTIATEYEEDLAIRNQETTATGPTAIIGQITNSGTISGITGIYLTGGGTTITNSGTIASTDGGNAIYFGGDNDLILTTGSVIDGTIAGGGTASQIALEGDGSLDTTIADFGDGSQLAVTPGADWTATGNWTIADVVNDGVFQPGRLGTPLTLTGDYLQNPDGTMRVLVTPTTSTQFNITGGATLSGTVSYVLAPGRYYPHVYPYLTATDGVSGTFTTVNYGEIPKGLAVTQYIEDPAVELVLTGPFTIPSIINPDDSTIFSAQTQALAQSADADTGALLEKATEGGAATSPACAAEAPLSPQKTGAAGGNAALASTLASVFCGAGGWVEATGSLGHADPSGGAPSYNANTAGFLAGVDKVVDPAGTRLGFAVGYDETYLSDKLGGGGRMGTTRVALYGAQPVGMFTLAGVLEYGNANNTTSRNSGDGDLSESNSVSIWSGGFQISTDLTMHGIEFLPAGGLRVASVGGGSHFAEGASGIAAAFAVSGKTTQYNSVQPYVLVEGKQNFYTASGVTLTPDAEIGYEYEAGTHGVVTTLVGADGTVFYTPHNDLDPSDALLSAGIAASKNNWSLFATYTAHVSGDWDTQIGEAGLRITF
jgi:hypothetical protein